MQDSSSEEPFGVPELHAEVQEAASKAARDRKLEATASEREWLAAVLTTLGALGAGAAATLDITGFAALGFALVAAGALAASRSAAEAAKKLANRLGNGQAAAARDSDRANSSVRRLGYLLARERAELQELSSHGQERRPRAY